MLGDAKHALAPVGAEEFKAQLHAAGEAAELAGKGGRAVNVRRVEGDEDRPHATGSNFFARRLGGNGRGAIALERLDPPTEAPDSRSHDQPRRKKAEQEHDQQQDRGFDVSLDVTPQVERCGRPVAAREQRHDHREKHPEQGLEELHRTRRI